MAATAQNPSPAGRLAGWARQGIESFVAAQKILLDLAAQENAMVIGVVRERLSNPATRPDTVIVKLADQGVENLTAVGKILLDLAAGETAIVADGVKEGLRLPVPADALASVVQHRVDTLIDMQRRLLDAVAEQTHAVAESYGEGKGMMAGTHVVELARRGIVDFVDTEKKFLNLAAEEVTAASKGAKEGHKSTRERSKVLTELAKEGVEKYIDAQKKLLNLAIHQMETNGKAAAEAFEDPRTSFAELTQKSVHNFVTAQKSLMDLAVKPMRPPAAEHKAKATHRAKRKHQ
jgi:hypothetical protein